MRLNIFPQFLIVTLSRCPGTETRSALPKKCFIVVNASSSSRRRDESAFPHSSMLNFSRMIRTPFRLLILLAIATTTTCMFSDPEIRSFASAATAAAPPSDLPLNQEPDPDRFAKPPTTFDDHAAYAPDQWEETRPPPLVLSPATEPVDSNIKCSTPISSSLPSSTLPPSPAPLIAASSSRPLHPPLQAPSQSRSQKSSPHRKPSISEPPTKQEGYDPWIFNVDDFGAVGNGIANDTQAFIDAWKVSCRQKKKQQRQQQPATMLVPSGKVYLVYPISLKGSCQSNFTLRVLGKIIAPSNPQVWNDFDNRLWILITKVSNFNLVGPGILDGQGFNWWAGSCKRDSSTMSTSTNCRYRLVHLPSDHSSFVDAFLQALTFRHSKNIEVSQMTITNSQQMHLDLSGCSNVSLRFLTIRSSESSPNTDGIHIERSDNLFVSQSTIATGDDCVSIGPGTSNVLIQDSTCGPGHGISIGSLGKKGTFERVSNVTVENVTLKNTMNGLRIKTWEGGRGAAHDFVFQHIVMQDVKNPIVIDQFYCDSEHSGTCKPKMKSGASRGVSISDVYYSDITGTSATQVAVMFRCSHPNPCHKISLQDVSLRYRNKQASSLCENAYRSVQTFVLPPTCLLSESKFLLATQRKHKSFHRSLL